MEIEDKNKILRNDYKSIITEKSMLGASRYDQKNYEFDNAVTDHWLRKKLLANFNFRSVCFSN